jgi:hypothetical protein
MVNSELIALLTELKNCVQKNGQMILISASFLDETSGKGIVRSLKETAKVILDLLGIRKRGQLWGWMRTQTEYRNLMQAAELSSITDGFFKTLHQQTYWIKGTKD